MEHREVHHLLQEQSMLRMTVIWNLSSRWVRAVRYDRKIRSRRINKVLSLKVWSFLGRVVFVGLGLVAYAFESSKLRSDRQ